MQSNQSNSSNTSLNNFSFEYRIDSAATKFLKVYNEHTYEDVFEGDVVKTGIGFTYRKSYPSLSDIWRKRRKDHTTKYYRQMRIRTSTFMLILIDGLFRLFQYPFSYKRSDALYRKAGYQNH